jgi:hypothetical protein
VINERTEALAREMGIPRERFGLVKRFGRVVDGMAARAL